MPNNNLRNITEGTEVRASLIAIKAELKDEGSVSAFKKDELYDKELFVKLLSHEDPKVRKNAVLIMGVLSDNEYAKYIYEAYSLSVFQPPGFGWNMVFLHPKE